MLTEIRARYTKGVIEPLEKLDLEEGEDIIISVRIISPKPEPKDGFEKAAGSWKGFVDTDQLLNDFRESRKIRAPEVRL